MKKKSWVSIYFRINSTSRTPHRIKITRTTLNNILHTNTLAENLADVQEKDRYDIILANPPFGGKERKEIQQNFPIKTGETAFLFLSEPMKNYTLIKEQVDSIATKLREAG